MRRLSKQHGWAALFVIFGGLVAIAGFFATQQTGALQLDKVIEPTATYTVPPPPTEVPFYQQREEPITVPTPTPREITKRVDLAQGVPDYRKVVFLVLRSNGEYEEYIIGDFQGSVEELKQLIGLTGNERIVNQYPLVPRHSTPILTPHRFTISTPVPITPEPTLEGSPYPAPIKP